MWAASSLGLNSRASFGIPIYQWIQEWVKMLLRDDRPRCDRVNSFFAGLWALWTFRNNAIFREGETDPSRLVDSMKRWEAICIESATSKLEDAKNKNSRVNTRVNVVELGQQQSGTVSRIIDVDGAWKKDKSGRGFPRCGIGWTYRQSADGDIIEHGKETVLCESPLHTELLGILHVQNWCQSRHFSEILIRTDCQKAIQLLRSTTSGPAHLQHLLEDIKKKGSSFMFCNVIKVSRQVIWKAHDLAVKARKRDTE
ncbi:uncharacterized protein LOC110723611 [Chenopodium quinoa]|uniref:uncharacterized protein LOC110723611 n=1 Tax=Chenopodium quinoa TaxID=63459 RepID=UPI000B78F31F|nr:uncharacterized protein LOC110723611 [Chenopodium quinoa]